MKKDEPVLLALRVGQQFILPSGSVVQIVARAHRADVECEYVTSQVSRGNITLARVFLLRCAQKL